MKASNEQLFVHSSINICFSNPHLLEDDDLLPPVPFLLGSRAFLGGGAGLVVEALGGGALVAAASFLAAVGAAGFDFSTFMDAIFFV